MESLNLDTSEINTLELTEPEDEAKKLIKILREEEKVDLIVALSHMRVEDDIKLTEKVSGIDLILVDKYL